MYSVWYICVLYHGVFVNEWTKYYTECNIYNMYSVWYTCLLYHGGVFVNEWTKYYTECNIFNMYCVWYTCVLTISWCICKWMN